MPIKYRSKQSLLLPSHDSETAILDSSSRLSGFHEKVNLGLLESVYNKSTKTIQSPNLYNEKLTQNKKFIKNEGYKEVFGGVFLDLKSPQRRMVKNFSVVGGKDHSNLQMSSNADQYKLFSKKQSLGQRMNDTLNVKKPLGSDSQKIILNPKEFNDIQNVLLSKISQKTHLAKYIEREKFKKRQKKSFTGEAWYKEPFKGIKREVSLESQVSLKKGFKGLSRKDSCFQPISNHDNLIGNLSGKVANKPVYAKENNISKKKHLKSSKEKRSKYNSEGIPNSSMKAKTELSQNSKYLNSNITVNGKPNPHISFNSQMREYRKPNYHQSKSKLKYPLEMSGIHSKKRVLKNKKNKRFKHFKSIDISGHPIDLIISQIQKQKSENNNWDGLYNGSKQHYNSPMTSDNRRSSQKNSLTQIIDEKNFSEKGSYKITNLKPSSLSNCFGKEKTHSNPQRELEKIKTNNSQSHYYNFSGQFSESKSSQMTPLVLHDSERMLIHVSSKGRLKDHIKKGRSKNITYSRKQGKDKISGSFTDKINYIMGIKKGQGKNQRASMRAGGYQDKEGPKARNKQRLWNKPRMGQPSKKKDINVHKIKEKGIMNTQSKKHFSGHISKKCKIPKGLKKVLKGSQKSSKAKHKFQMKILPEKQIQIKTCKTSKKTSNSFNLTPKSTSQNLERASFQNSNSTNTVFAKKSYFSPKLERELILSKEENYEANLTGVLKMQQPTALFEQYSFEKNDNPQELSWEEKEQVVSKQGTSHRTDELIESRSISDRQSKNNNIEVLDHEFLLEDGPSISAKTFEKRPSAPLGTSLFNQIPSNDFPCFPPKTPFFSPSKGSPVINKLPFKRSSTTANRQDTILFARKASQQPLSVKKNEMRGLHQSYSGVKPSDFFNKKNFKNETSIHKVGKIWNKGNKNFFPNQKTKSNRLSKESQPVDFQISIPKNKPDTNKVRRSDPTNLSKAQLKSFINNSDLCNANRKEHNFQGQRIPRNNDSTIERNSVSSNSVRNAKPTQKTIPTPIYFKNKFQPDSLKQETSTKQRLKATKFGSFTDQQILSPNNSNHFQFENSFANLDKEVLKMNLSDSLLPERSEIIISEMDLENDGERIKLEAASKRSDMSTGGNVFLEKNEFVRDNSKQDKIIPQEIKKTSLKRFSSMKSKMKLLKLQRQDSQNQEYFEDQQIKMKQNNWNNNVASPHLQSQDKGIEKADFSDSPKNNFYRTSFKHQSKPSKENNLFKNKKNSRTSLQPSNNNPLRDNFPLKHHSKKKKISSCNLIDLKPFKNSKDLIISSPPLNKSENTAYCLSRAVDKRLNKPNIKPEIYNKQGHKLFWESADTNKIPFINNKNTSKTRNKWISREGCLNSNIKLVLNYLNR